MRVSIVMLLALGGLWGDFTKIYRTNTLITASYNTYLEQQYDSTYYSLRTLIDSMKVDDIGLHLNLAHTRYMQNGFGSATGTNFSNRSDSTYVQMAEGTFYSYSKLWDTQNDIASIGYNQSGIITFKSRIVAGKLSEEEALIQSCLSYFKSALRKDPSNEKARYNYEVLKKYKEFPEMVMTRVRNLVEQRRYEDALYYLGPFIEKDKRFEKYVDYGKRLSDIVTIETADES